MPRARFVWVALTVLLAAGCRGEPATGPPQRLSPDDIARNNRGVGLMGRFAFAEAAREFDALATERPGQLDVDVNLAIAVLNRQGPDDLDRAERILRDRVLAADPRNQRGAYVLALLLLYAGRSTEAATLLRRVAESDPSNAFATYFLAQSLAASGQTVDALERYQRTISLDPLFRSAYYGAFQALQRLGREAEGADLLKRFQDLEADPRAVVAEFKYTRMGPLAEAATIDLAPAAARVALVGPLFAPAAPLAIDRTLRWGAVDARATVTVVDVNHDGLLDLFATAAVASVTEPNALLLGQADGTFRVDSHTPLSRVTDVRAVLWGDYDNDGLVDAFLCRPRGGSQLWRQLSGGQWRDVTRAATLSPPADAIDGAAVDADHDGDLDIWVLSRSGADELLNNNGNGTFRRIGAVAGISGDGRGSRGIAFADLDGDRDADVVVLRATPPHDVYLNDRLWRYRPAPGLEAFRHARIDAAVAGDVDANGASELYTRGPAGLDRWARNDRGVWQQTSLAVVDQTLPVDRAQLALADVDGDGRLDLLATTGRSWMVVDPSASAGQAPRFVANDADLASVAVAVLDPAAGPSMVGVPRAGAPVLWRPGPGRHPFLAIAFTGRDSGSDQMRSNRSGIGTRSAIRTGSQWTVIDTWQSQSGPGQSLQPVAVGLGGAPQADFAAVTWSDGVYQTELALAARALHTIEETQRQLSSCPVLFAFDGRGFAFVTDVLGVGGIGFLERPGAYGEPYPREHVLLPVERIAPVNGRYLLKIGEPMEEATYLDAAWLSVYDLPPGWQMTLDERKALVAPPPTGEPRFFMRDRVPIRASNDRGEDVTAAVGAADLVAAPPGRVDPRFIGRTDTHALTLEFDAVLDEGDGEPLLVLDGWIEYPYAQTVFAAWQAGEAYQAPTLEARDGTGRWRTLLREFGYPAGMPRQMSVPLGRLPPGTRALRLSSSQEIYWDRVAVAYTRSAPDVRRVRLSVAGARLEASGFAQRSTGPQRTPRYDYERRLPLWDTRHQRGWYTAFGPVEPLVSDEDGAVAVFGPGEEVHLEFPAPPPAPPGWTRRVVLETRGWCKDMDLYTRDGETIEPLPGSPSVARDELHRRFNTRYASGR